jgi:hypothetical protein
MCADGGHAPVGIVVWDAVARSQLAIVSVAASKVHCLLALPDADATADAPAHAPLWSGNVWVGLGGGRIAVVDAAGGTEDSVPRARLLKEWRYAR